MKVGIVGAGFVAQYHVKAWRNIGAEVVAVCDVVEEKAREFASRYRIPRYFKSVEEMVKSVKLDFASVCTPPQTHRDVALQLINAGVNLVVEKPLALSFAEALEIVEKAKSANVKVAPTANFIYTPLAIKAREMVREIGGIRRVDVVVYAPNAVISAKEGGWLNKLPGGAFGEVLPHPIYIAQSFLGKLSVISVHYARASNSPWTFYDELFALLRGERGLGSVRISYNAERFDIYVYIEGSKGSIIVNPVGKTLLKLHTSWGVLKNALGFTPLIRVGLDVVFGRVNPDPFTNMFKAYIVRGEYPSVDVVLNQVEVYEKILSHYE